MPPELAGSVNWDTGSGLVPAIVQDAANGRVLMVGYMNREALELTLSTKRVTFFSRSRGRLWTKGETSGHILDLVRVEPDCDRDALLVLANPNGPTCHLETVSCFENAPANFLSELDALVASREKERPLGSYTTKLFESGTKRIAQKVGEEAVETALAAATGDSDEALLGEAADLVYHLTVLLRSRSLGLRDVVEVLRRRHTTKPGR